MSYSPDDAVFVKYIWLLYSLEINLQISVLHSDVFSNPLSMRPLFHFFILQLFFHQLFPDPTTVTRNFRNVSS